MMGVYFKIEEYHRPQDLLEAVDFLTKFGNKARVIAGGTDILPLRPGAKQIEASCHLVDISGLDFGYIRKENNHIRIGAAATVNCIGKSSLFLSGSYGALTDAAEAHSTATIRNRATIGGNLCMASPCGDLALPLLVLDAILVVTGANGKKEIPIESFFKGANYADLNPEEILHEILIPFGSEKSGTSFLKLRRHQTAVDMAIVNVATSVSCENGYCKIARIALGSVGPIPFRAKKAESLLTGSILTEEVIQRAAAKAAEEARPIDDVRSTCAYRKQMVVVLVRRSLETSLRRSGQ
jgi:carbon-monoxide dehydrogenase medium subunit